MTLFWIIIGIIVIGLAYKYLKGKGKQPKAEEPLTQPQASVPLSKRKVKKRWILGGIVLLIIFIVILSGGEGEKKSSSEPTSIQYVTEAGTPERVIEEKFIQILGADTNMGEERLKQIKVYTYDYANNYQNVDIEYMADENLTTGMTKTGMWMDAMEVLEELPTVLNTQVMKITLNPQFKLVDQYGQESIEKVMTIRVTRETWEKINWDNFITDNIPTISETYWEHPAFND